MLGDAASAFGDFEAAIRHNPNDPDIYYHRGQGELLNPCLAAEAVKADTV